MPHENHEKQYRRGEKWQFPANSATFSRERLQISIQQALEKVVKPGMIKS